MRFANAISDLELATKSTISFDFGSSSFLKPSHFVVLACCVELLAHKFKCDFKFIGGEGGLNNHLANTKFKRYWTEGFDRDNFTLSHNSTTLCLWHVSKSMIDQYGQQAQKYFRNHYFSDKDLQPLSQSLVEAFNNIFDHSNSEIQGYVITQYFPNIYKLTFAVCDFGDGIPNTINLFLERNSKEKLPDNLAIEKSLERGMTIQSTPSNAGFGLANILDISQNCKGKLTIFSRQGYFIKEHNKIKLSGILSYPFKGTLIIVELDTNSFDDYDTENDIYEF